MRTKQLRATIADIDFVLNAEGCSFADAPLKGFATEAGSAAGDDRVDVTVRLAENSPAPEIRDVRFSAKKDAFEDNCRTEWYLCSPTSADWEEEIIQYCGEEQNIKWASLRYSRNRAELTICHIKDTQGVVSPFTFPLLNIYLSRMMQLRGGFMIHSSVVEDKDGKGLLFTAVSGTGKSTIAHIFEGEGATIVNDDMVVVRPGADGGARAYAIPMRAYAQRPRSVALGGLFFISQSPKNWIERKKGATVVARVMSNSISQPFDAANALRLIGNISGCCLGIPAFTLGFKPDAEVVGVIRNALKGA